MKLTHKGHCRTTRTITIVKLIRKDWQKSIKLYALLYFVPPYGQTIQKEEIKWKSIQKSWICAYFKLQQQFSHQLEPPGFVNGSNHFKKDQTSGCHGRSLLLLWIVQSIAVCVCFIECIFLMMNDRWWPPIHDRRSQCQLIRNGPKVHEYRIPCFWMLRNRWTDVAKL